jgi:hypothetical protein
VLSAVQLKQVTDCMQRGMLKLVAPSGIHGLDIKLHARSLCFPTILLLLFAAVVAQASRDTSIATASQSVGGKRTRSAVAKVSRLPQDRRVLLGPHAGAAHVRDCCCPAVCS